MMVNQPVVIDNVSILLDVCIAQVPQVFFPAGMAKVDLHSGKAAKKLVLMRHSHYDIICLYWSIPIFGNRMFLRHGHSLGLIVWTTCQPGFDIGKQTQETIIALSFTQGSGVIKCGFAGDQIPKCRFPN